MHPLRLLIVGAVALGLATLVAACPPTETGLCPPGRCAASQVCLPDTGACVALPQCQSDTDCADAGGGNCLEGICSRCDTNVACETSFTRCDQTTGECAECADAGDCAAPFPMCGKSGCAQCVANSDCPASSPVCDGLWCVQCDEDTDCPPGEGCFGGACTAPCVDGGCPGPLGAEACIYASGVTFADRICVECRHTGQCPAGEACYQGACRAARPGDGCTSAIPVNLQSGSALVRGMLQSTGEWVEPVVYGAEGADLYFRVEVTEDSEITAWGIAEERYPFPTPEMVVELFGGQCGAISRMARAVDRIFVAPGVYYLRVSAAEYYTVTEFDLHVQLAPATRQQGNSCFYPLPLPLDGGVASVLGDTTGLPVIHAEPCRGGYGEQSGLVYRLPLEVKSHVALRVTPLDAGMNVGFSLRDECLENASYEACLEPDRTWAYGGIGPLEAGEYALQVRTEPDAGGPFRLDVEVNPWATNDTCETAEPLQFVGDTAVARGDLRYASYIGPTCSSYQSHALNYRFSTLGMGERSVRVQVEPRTNTEVTLATVCQSDAPEPDVVKCGKYGVASFDLPRLPEGDYFLQLTSGTTYEPVDLEVKLGPPYPAPPNDACADAGVLDLSVTNPITVAGDTRGAQADNYVCSNWAEEARDVAYQLIVPTRGAVNLDVVATSPEFDPRMRVGGNSCPGSGACVNSSDGGTESTTYLLDGYSSPLMVFVAGAPLYGGSFEVTAEYVAPPGNDTCSGTVPSLGIPSTLTGELTGAYPDNIACRASYGPDLFFQLRPSSNMNVTLTLTPSGFNGVLQVLSACTSATCVAEADATLVDGVETVTFAASRNTTYYVKVGATSHGQTGSFTLQVQ